MAQSHTRLGAGAADWWITLPRLPTYRAHALCRSCDPTARRPRSAAGSHESSHPGGRVGDAAAPLHHRHPEAARAGRRPAGARAHHPLAGAMRRRPGRPVRESPRAADLRLPGERRSATRGGAELPLGVRAARHRGCPGGGAGPRGHVHRHERRRADDARLPQVAGGPPRAGRRADRRHAQQRRAHRSRRDRVRGRPGLQLHREAHAALRGQHGHLRLRPAGAPISPRRPVPVPGPCQPAAGGGRARRRMPERCRLVRHRHPQRVRACGRRRGAVPGQVRHGAAAFPAARARAARARRRSRPRRRPNVGVATVRRTPSRRWTARHVGVATRFAPPSSACSTSSSPRSRWSSCCPSSCSSRC